MVDGDGTLRGLISIREIRESLAAEGLEHWLLAADLMGPARLTVGRDVPLKDAFGRMRKVGVEVAPVLADEAGTKLVGMLEAPAVLRAITGQLLRMHAVDAGGE